MASSELTTDRLLDGRTETGVILVRSEPSTALFSSLEGTVVNSHRESNRYFEATYAL